MKIFQIPVLKDNYVYFLRDEENDLTAVVDPSAFDPVDKALQELELTPTHIFNTHHHWDHTDGNVPLKEKYGCVVVGYDGDAHRIRGIDVKLKDDEAYQFGAYAFRVMFIPGHTLGHIALWFEKEKLLFCGDTVFMMGCGRLFEGTPEQMHASHQKIMALPDETMIYCGHEYTQANAKFALTLEPGNEALQGRAKEVSALRAQGKPTVPGTLALEKATNPFLRTHSEEIRRTLAMPDALAVDVFAEMRRRKDRF